jgi:hypothetical protein
MRGRWVLTWIAAVTLTGCWGFSHTINYSIVFTPEAVHPGDPLPAAVEMTESTSRCYVHWAEYLWIPYGRAGMGALLVTVPNTSTDVLTIDLSQSAILHAGRKVGLAKVQDDSIWLADATLTVATVLPGEKFVAQVCPAGFEGIWKRSNNTPVPWCDLWDWVGEGSKNAQSTTLMLSVTSNGRHFTVTRQFLTKVSAERSRTTWWIFGPGG